MMNSRMAPRELRLYSFLGGFILGSRKQEAGEYVVCGRFSTFSPQKLDCQIYPSQHAWWF
jgi:hypothetical protein